MRIKFIDEKEYIPKKEENIEEALLTKLDIPLEIIED